MWPAKSFARSSPDATCDRPTLRDPTTAGRAQRRARGGGAASRRPVAAEAADSAASRLAHLLARDGLLANEANSPAMAESPARRNLTSTADCTIGPGPNASCTCSHVSAGAANNAIRWTTSSELIRRNSGQPFDPGDKVELFQSDPGACMQSPWAWRQYGECGKWISDLVPHLAQCVDDMAFIPSMVAKSNVHGPATFMQNSGFVLPGFPALGAWLSYGLGSMASDLPTFVVLPDSRGFAPNGPGNWTAGFLPAAASGDDVPARAALNPIADLFPLQPRPVSSNRPAKRNRPGSVAAAESRTSKRRASRRLATRSAPDPLATNWPPDCKTSCPRSARPVG